jgi:hypothetical protein
MHHTMPVSCQWEFSFGVWLRAVLLVDTLFKTVLLRRSRQRASLSIRYGRSAYLLRPFWLVCQKNMWQVFWILRLPHLKSKDNQFIFGSRLILHRLGPDILRRTARALCPRGLCNEYNGTQIATEIFFQEWITLSMINHHCRVQGEIIPAASQLATVSFEYAN